MGLWANIVDKLTGGKLKKQEKQLQRAQNEILSVFEPSFSKEAKVEFNATYMACVNSITKHLLKIRPTPMIKNEIAQNRKRLNRILTLKANALQTAPKVWKTLANCYYKDGMAVAWIERDLTLPRDNVVGLWPLDLDKNSLQLVVAENGETIAKFNLNGATRYAPYSDLIILTREVDIGSLFKTRNEGIQQVIRLIQTNYEGMEQALKASQFIRFIVENSAPLSEQTMKERQERFSKQFFDNKSGLIYTDAANKIIEVNSKGRWVESENLDLLKKDIYSYFGITEKILQGDYSEDNYQSFYETTLEPFIVELAAELTTKIYSETEIEANNYIEVLADRLQTASMTTKIKMADIVRQMGIYKPNDIYRILGLPLTENGEKEIQSLNYVNATKADTYQEVGNPNDPTEKLNSSEEEKQDGK